MNHIKKSIIFTICANNYLAHAAVLAESFKKHNPALDFYIVVADEKSDDVDYHKFHADNVVFINEIIPAIDLDVLSQKFNLTEFCTAIKPDVLLYLKKMGCSYAVYLDPDIEVFDTLGYIYDLLKNHAIILTPHICSPIEMDSEPNDYHLLRSGVYNLGFVAFNLDKSENFLRWWKERVFEYGYRIDEKGMFYDQIWMGYAPAFEDSTYLLRNLEYNVANWNLHERTLLFSDNAYYVNDLNTRLVFFHFSHFKIDDLPRIATYNESYTIDNREDIKPLYLSYKSQLEAHGIKNFENIKYAYGRAGDSGKSKETITTSEKISRSAHSFRKAFKILFS